MIKNINIHIEGKMDIIDGWEELDDQMQGKVRRTMEQGHVDDDDWMGEPAYNRPGMHGMFYKEKRPRRRKDPETGEFIDPVSGCLSVYVCSLNQC